MTTFEDKLNEHNYKIFSASAKKDNPIILIADIHSKQVEKRNHAMLQDLLTEEDMLFMEGTFSGMQYPDIQKQFFDAAKFEQQARQDVRTLYEERREEVLKIPRNEQRFLCEVTGSDDDIIFVVCLIAKNMYDVNKNRLVQMNATEFSGETAKSLERSMKFAMNIFTLATSYRNNAIARTLRQKYDENPTRKIYHVVGAQHVLTLDSFVEIGVDLDQDLQSTTGQLCALLSEQNVPYVVIGSNNFLLEYVLARITI